LLKDAKPNSDAPGELEGADVEKIADSVQPRLGLSERSPHGMGELHFIEPGVKAPEIGWLVIALEVQIPV
jgi:hypothetical protein